MVPILRGNPAPLARTLLIAYRLVGITFDVQKELKNLRRLDVLGCPFSDSASDYRERAFAALEQINYLDGLDRDGEEDDEESSEEGSESGSEDPGTGSAICYLLARFYAPMQ